jgi:hypothetical protein
MNKEVNPDGYDMSSLLSQPKSVAIVALGPSAKSFTREMMGNGYMNNPFDEIWTLNRGLKAFPHDKLFVMDDLKWLEKKQPAYAAFLKKHDKPIITSTAYIDYPMSVEYPFQEVLETIQDDVFAVNTVSYMLAYAIHLRVKEISIYGADFIYPNGNTAEKGGQAVAYLCGMMRSFELTHRIPGDSTLLYANTVKHDPQGNLIREPYGYHRKREMEDDDKREANRIEAQRVLAEGGNHGA